MRDARRKTLDARSGRRAGMTLLEVLLAVFILGVCSVGLLKGMVTSLEVFHSAEFVQQARNVLARGDAEYPLEFKDDPIEELAVSPDSGLLDGWSYERECEEDEDEDGLFLVRTKVSKGKGGFGNEIEFCRLIYAPETVK